MNFLIVYKNIYTWICNKISLRNYEKLSKHKFFSTDNHQQNSMDNSRSFYQNFLPSYSFFIIASFIDKDG